MQRQCECCKKKIQIDRVSKHNIVLYKGKYYHDECFICHCQTKSQSKRYQSLWEDALRNIDKYKKDAEKEISFNFTRDDFNTYLLAHYDIVAVPGDFWRIVSEIENGFYRKKKCNPIDLCTFFECWRWGQRNLDKIAANNKMKHIGPKTDTERLKYDLAILVGKIPVYLKEKAKNEAENQLIAAKERVDKTNAFDYEALSKQAVTNATKESNDILDIMNEIF